MKGQVSSMIPALEEAQAELRVRLHQPPQPYRIGRNGMRRRISDQQRLWVTGYISAIEEALQILEGKSSSETHTLVIRRSATVEAELSLMSSPSVSVPICVEKTEVGE